MTTLKKRLPRALVGLMIFSVCFALIVGGLIALNTANAAGFGLDQTGLGHGGENDLLAPIAGDDIKGIIGNVIKYLLGFLGVIFLILILYAGYIWMMARGDEKEVGKAMGLIKTSVIGVAIILFAYIIASFVLTAIPNATSDTGVKTAPTLQGPLP